MTDITVTALGMDSLDELCCLESVCFPSDPWSRSSIAASLSSEAVAVFGVIENGTLVASCFVSHVQDMGEVQNIAVHPTMRRRGIGSTLLSHALDELTKFGCADILLEVRKSNTSAIALYEKLGFKHIGIRKNYYSSPREDALIMLLSCSRGTSSAI